jgi:hypothetical protein
MMELSTKCLAHWTIVFSFFVASCINLKAQVPQAIPYQAVARDTAGNLIINQSISLRFSIHDSTAGGTVVYQETQSKTTNALGLFVANIGEGIIVNGTFSAINWANGNKFIQVEMDATGSTNYTDMGTQQMLSVPYALFAKEHYQYSKFYFPNSTIWICPVNISQITVELWGGAGGGGGGYVGGSCDNGYGSANGGNGGRGGYNRQIISVTSGNSYTITIGQGGTGGGANNSGNPGGVTIFGNNLLSADGGQGGAPGYRNPFYNCYTGSSGQNGSVINCSQTINDFSRSYILPAYQKTNDPMLCKVAIPGTGGMQQGAGAAGENGMCVISY